MKKLTLGLDASTQSLTALVLETDSEKPEATRILLEKAVGFDADLPEFGTKNGVLPAPSGAQGVVHAPPQLWVKALELVFARLKEAGVALDRIEAVAVSGQQHGSVYLKAEAARRLANLDPAKGLAEQLEGVYSRATSPIWMDASTSAECGEITAALGGHDAVCRLTGSRAFERFTGPQIRKFHKTEPEAYRNTDQILLVSSFVPSLLAGKLVGIDPGDGAGMNLMDLAKRAWDPKALEATAPGLGSKLLPIIPSEKPVGTISPYFVSRFGFSPECQVVPGTGDNCSSLVGLGLVSPGAWGISLGTSDTVFAFLSEPRTDPTGASHVFGSPTGAYMAISVYQNGSLAREAVRQAHGWTWPEFSQALESTQPGNGGRMMLPYFGTEIIPRIRKPEVWRKGFEAGNPCEARAVVEAQMASMANHAAWMGELPSRVQATGGASDNAAILQIMADMLEVPVIRQETSASAALGAALRAWQPLAVAKHPGLSWKDITAPHISAAKEVRPRREAVEACRSFKLAYAQWEAEAALALG